MARRFFGALIAAGVVLLSGALAALASEGVLRLVLDPADFLHATLVDDPVLGHRIGANTSGHDALGFRNGKVPEQVRIVAIGDSNTYGVSATREGSWPQQLAGQLGEPVYNMGLGGYGPLQYLHLVREVARPMKPGVILVGYYFGNDLMDAYIMAHARPYWHAWRQSERSGRVEPEPTVETPTKRFRGLRDWLARHSMLYSVLRATLLQRLAMQEREQLVRQSSPDSRWAWAETGQAGVRTVFTPQVRLSALDLDKPEVREGLQIGERALAALRTEAEAQGARVVVVLIPTKERAYCRHLQQAAAQIPPSFAKLCTNEEAARKNLLRYLGEHRVAYVDTLPALEAAIERHEQLYPVDADGHLQAAGYGVVAATVADALRAPAAKP